MSQCRRQQGEEPGWGCSCTMVLALPLWQHEHLAPGFLGILARWAGTGRHKAGDLSVQGEEGEAALEDIGQVSPWGSRSPGLALAGTWWDQAWAFTL